MDSLTPEPKNLRLPRFLLLQLTWPQPVGWDTPDVVLVGTRSRNGAEGTYNHLNDAILDVAVTRAMYMRRLRTLADKYLAGGRIKQVGTPLGVGEEVGRERRCSEICWRVE
jgi:hypothetical protein